MDIRFALIGLLIGFLVGLTGVGGGSLMTPVMILILGVKPVIAVGTDLAYSAVTKIVGGATHLRQGTVHRRTAYLLAAGSVPASILGVGVTSAIKRSDPALVNGFLLHAIASVLILVAVVLIAKPFIVSGARRVGMRSGSGSDWRDDAMDFGNRHAWILVCVGALVGFLLGLTSVGGGSLVIAVLLFLYPRWETKDMVGTDVFHAAILGVAASLAQLAAGNVNLSMMTSLLVGSIPGVLIGSRLVINFPERILRLSLASVMLVSGAKLF
jgi:uncharacterized membrane protein YfcA